MPLAAGTQLGPYEIVALIGAGGMGEVYRAHDTRLGRDVAIKVSAQQFTERFDREARAVAALNHPNICTLFDVGPNYLVMELVEGANLAGPVPLETALNYARQITDALEAAHEKGIVHRDLKPANIKIKPGGMVKVLDFGLAKQIGAGRSGGDPENSPTLSMAATNAGVILGTAAYMPPEQARGEPVDKRADIWAFGVVLYEMITGQRMFEGKTVSDTLAAVLIKEPDLDRVPAHMRPLLRRCLAKEPSKRLHHAADVRLLLDEAPGVEPAISSPVSARRGLIAYGGAVVLALLLALLAFVHFREKPPVAEVVRFHISPPDKTTFTGPGPYLSPDGHLVAFTAAGADGRNSIWVRSLDAVDARALPGTEGIDARELVWSPDSRWILFGSPDNKLKKVEVSGGTPQTVCNLDGAFRGASWTRNGNSEGVILFGVGRASSSGIYLVPEAGGTASQIHSNFSVTPVFLPDGRHFLFSVPNGENNGIYVGSLDSMPDQRDAKRLVVTPSSPVLALSPDSVPSKARLLFVQAGVLMAQPFDTDRRELTGPAVPIAESLASTGPPGYSASASGILAYRTGVTADRIASKLTWFDRQGKPLGNLGEPGRYSQIALSRDGKQAAIALDAPFGPNGQAGRPDIWIHDLVRGTSARLTSNLLGDVWPVWSPDGSSVIFSSQDENSTYHLYRQPSSGASAAELLLKSDEQKYAQDWSRDGKFVLYSTNTARPRGDVRAGGFKGRIGRGGQVDFDLWVLRLTSGSSAERKEEPYLKTDASESGARFSPDGRFVAYTSDESGRNEVYVRPFPVDASSKWTVSKGGGTQPRWSRDGREIVYLAADYKMMAVDVSVSPVFKPGVPKVLFQTDIDRNLNNIAVSNNVSRYDVTSDGSKFLMYVQPPEVIASAPAPITVILNWPALR